MDRFRALLGKKKKEQQESRRRASHAGFAAPRVEDLQKRRVSLPANIHKKNEDDARKLHNSAACINIIEEMKSVKLISKVLKHNAGMPMALPIKKHALDPFLQKQLRARRTSTTLHVEASVENVPAEPVVKKAISVENINRSKIDRDQINLVRSSSESLLTGIDVQDPEENDLSDEELPVVQAAA